MRRFKTIQARAKDLIRRDSGRLPSKHVWIRAIVKNGVRRELGTSGLALSETCVRNLMKAQPRHVLFGGEAEELVLAYCCLGEELFANAFEATYAPSELL